MLKEFRVIHAAESLDCTLQSYSGCVEPHCGGDTLELTHWLEDVAWRMDLPFGLPGTMTCITQSQFWVASKCFVQF